MAPDDAAADRCRSSPARDHRTGAGIPDRVVLAGWKETNAQGLTSRRFDGD